MRLVTWNCCRGKIVAKAPHALALAPDVLVMPECAKPAADDSRWLWMGENPNQGLGVWAREGTSLRRLPGRPDVPRFAFPVEVGGPEPFFLLAIWSLADKPHPYVKAVIRAVETYADVIASRPSVVMGDFNSNAIWNRKTPGSRDHGYLVSLLAELGLVSAYHRFTGEAHGAETQPTFYLTWNRLLPLHIDYCFLPREWAARLACVRVGGYDDWCTVSDHRPLVVDVAPGGGYERVAGDAHPRAPPEVRTG
jgi:hypothetical protein